MHYTYAVINGSVNLVIHKDLYGAITPGTYKIWFAMGGPSENYIQVVMFKRL